VVGSRAARQHRVPTAPGHSPLVSQRCAHERAPAWSCTQTEPAAQHVAPHTCSVPQQAPPTHACPLGQEPVGLLGLHAVAGAHTQVAHSPRAHDWVPVTPPPQEQPRTSPASQSKPLSGGGSVVGDGSPTQRMDSIAVITAPRSPCTAPPSFRRRSYINIPPRVRARLTGPDVAAGSAELVHTARPQRMQDMSGHLPRRFPFGSGVQPTSPSRSDLYARPSFRTIVGRVAANTRRLREERGWTQVQAAVRCEMATFVLQTVEAGRRNLSATTLARLCDGFGVDVQELMVPAAPLARPTKGRPRKTGGEG
jgi:hypothetical protein